MASPTKTSAWTFVDLRLALGVGDDLADLGVAAAAVDARHQLGKPLAPATPSATPGIRSSRGSRRAGHRGRRWPPSRGTCRPAAGRRYPRAAAGSWWRRARRSAARAGPARSRAQAPSPASRKASISARCDVGRGRLSAAGRWRLIVTVVGHGDFLGGEFAALKVAITASRRNARCAAVSARCRPIPRAGRAASSGFSIAANHSARAAARRWPRASSGSLSASIRLMTSARAVT